MTSTTALHFGPEWMRAKPAARPSPLLEGSPGTGTGSLGTGSPAHSYSYSLLATPASNRPGDVSFKYSREEMLQIYKDAVSRPELSAEVERWDGVVNEDAHEPVGLHDMDEVEKKLFSLTLNSELRRRQSQDTLTLALPGTSPSSAKFHGPSSPLRERPFGAMMNRRRDSDAAQPGYMPRRPSLTQTPGVNGPLSPSLASPRPRMDGWLQRKKTGGFDGNRPDDKPRDGIEVDNPADGSAPTKGDSTNLNGTDNAAQNPGDTAPAVQDAGTGAPEPSSHDGALANGHATNGSGLGSSTNAPPSVPLPPPATINWQYRDPMGIVQGPFIGQLMQDWYNQGFFPAELHMKRIEFDVEWRSVREWEVIGGKQFFLVPLNISKPPPGLPPALAAPPPTPPVALSQTSIQPGFSPQTTLASTTDPYQSITKPSRAATLDTTATDSTTSSYNATFGQPETGPFGAVRPPRFNTLDNKSNDIPGAGYASRAAWDHNNSFQDTGMYGTNSFNGAVPASPSTSFSQSSYPSVQPTTPYGAIGRAPGSRAARPDGFASAVGNDDFGRTSMGLGSSALNQEATSALGLGRPSPMSVPRSRQASYASDAAWASSESSSFAQPSRLGAAPVDPAIVSATRGVDFAGRSNPGRPQAQPSAWYYASQGHDDAAWGSAPGSVTDLPGTLVQEPAAMDARIDNTIPTPPLHEPTQLAVTSARPKAAFVPAPIGKPAGTAAPAQSPALPLAQAVKVASPWAKPVEDPAPKSKQTLRDIQEAEAKHAEALRKAAAAAAPKERPVASRAATEDLQSVTTSWGLPTSQAGQAPRAAPKEPSPLTPGSAAASAAAGVWTNAPKPAVVAKKSVKQIQEEEERNKRTAAKDASVIESARRGYAQTANKTATPSVWTTVGSSGKPNPIVAATARPSSAAASPATTPLAGRVANGTVARPAAASQHVKQPSASKPAEEPFVAPSTDFMKWLREALKDLNQVNLDEFMRLLLTFPIDPRDPSVVETIADTVYMYSSTMDGRRFAAEFCSRRKADAASKKGAIVTNPATKQTMLAEAVKSQPKAAPVQSDWKPAGASKKKRSGKQ
ncbi:hypothetical protein EXIGLDRAFT_834204 [Exidia glandulosa HHB12029]|uniref:GYF domain-containing protein n=1 Tax=Exidia glandulosa HHB12029 TaxID=1314781 RepID=A0A165K083_EXIGL|nr:hypothetical protein EXIGLDRAFT_834204 [Exidia glandulosa HHB12029]